MEFVTVTEPVAMTAARARLLSCRGANTAHAVIDSRVMGTRVSIAKRDLTLTGTGSDPITGVVCPRLEAPPV